MSRIALHLLGPAFPWGTWIVNLLGGLLMGLLAGMLLREGEMNEPLRLLLGTGVLGGFTTFSAFSLESANMLQRGDYALALAYMISSVAGSILMLFLGFWLMKGAAA
ncbi:MAG TPA: CrcB family protein [Allosphingosinicella sp.]